MTKRKPEISAGCAIRFSQLWQYPHRHVTNQRPRLSRPVIHRSTQARLILYDLDTPYEMLMKDYVVAYAVVLETNYANLSIAKW